MNGLLSKKVFPATLYINPHINAPMNIHSLSLKEELIGGETKVLICLKHPFRLGLEGENFIKEMKNIIKRGKRW